MQRPQLQKIVLKKKKTKPVKAYAYPSKLLLLQTYLRIIKYGRKKKVKLFLLIFFYSMAFLPMLHLQQFDSVK